MTAKEYLSHNEKLFVEIFDITKSNSLLFCVSDFIKNVSFVKISQNNIK